MRELTFMPKIQPGKVYQLYISLKHIKPAIWRRFWVTDDVTLAKLHRIIQIVMGWDDEHVHEFTIGGRKIGTPFEEWFNLDVENEKNVRLSELNLAEKQKFQYEYDFGDGWQHEIRVEKILPFERGHKYPTCLVGEVRQVEGDEVLGSRLNGRCQDMAVADIVGHLGDEGGADVDGRVVEGLP